MPRPQLAIVVLSFLFVFAADADTIDLRDREGIGYFADTDTGLTWIDVDTYFGMTYAAIQSALPAGYSIATYSQILGLHGSLPHSGYADWAPRVGDSNRVVTRLVWGFYDVGDPRFAAESWMYSSPATFTGGKWNYSHIGGLGYPAYLHPAVGYSASDLGAWAVGPALQEVLPTSFKTAFEMGFAADSVLVKLDVQLVGADPGAGLLAIWESGIESLWNGQYEVVDGDRTYPITIDARFVSESTATSVAVNVVAGDGRPNMLTWYTGNPAGWGTENQGRVAAHEIGHMLGLYDEYSGGTLDPLMPIFDPASIMGSQLGTPRERHYQYVLDWLLRETGRTMVLGQLPTFQPGMSGLPPAEAPLIPSEPVPELPTWLLASTLIALRWRWRSN